ncbi:MAG: glycoside hydrolase family 25 protein, partial [Clostridia bacterium]|nr:glycoside hydrolase family 25 protein [Clostridia bacterium]
AIRNRGGDYYHVTNGQADISNPAIRANQNPKFGIDVSHYQGEIDWERVKPQIDFAILRCGLGDDMKSQDDKQFERNYNECMRLNIPVKIYFFTYAVSKDNIDSEIAHIQRLLAGKTVTSPVYIDVENTKSLDWRTISNEELLSIMQEFNSRLDALGYKMGIYSSRSAFWNEKMTDGWYATVSKWVAEYDDCVNDFDRSYDIWQYTSKGSIDGIDGNVDLVVWITQN